MTADRVTALLDVYGASSGCAADLLCDRHRAGAVAFTVVDTTLAARDVTFGELREASARFASGLARLGVGAGDRVATLMGRSADLVVAMLATWRLGAVQVPLFTAFGPAAIAARITGNGTKVVVTDAARRGALVPGEDLPADPARRIVTTGPAAGGDVGFGSLLDSAPHRSPVAIGGAGTLVELFTSGTTGAPKAVPVPLRALAAFHLYQEHGLDHRETDVFWNAADPGWAYGLYHAILGPLALGRRAVLLRGGFSAETTWAVLAALGVTVFAAGPTVYRALRDAGVPAPAGLRLRRCASAGEPLPPDVVGWAGRTLGVPVLDHYGQTELGMAVGGDAAPPPGSLGRALPGWRLVVLGPDDAPVAPGEPGRLAVDVAGSPLMWFTGYRNAPDRTAARFTGGGAWYLTGDTATMDADGGFRYRARDDDVILMSGYRIDPSEVEGVLLRHDAVAEAAVVGEPDPLRGEVLVAHVVPRPGTTPGDELAAELQLLVKTRLAAHLYPRSVHFVPELPRTPSGKLQRYRLRRAPATGTASRPDRR